MIISENDKIQDIISGLETAYIDSNIPKLSRYFISKVESYLKDNRNNFFITI